MRSGSGERARPGASDVGGTRARRREYRVVGKHGRVQASQALARFEAELLGEHPARLVVDAKSVGLPSAAIEREHQVSAQAFPERVVGNEGVQPRCDVAVPPQCKLDVDLLLDCDESKLLEPRNLALCKRVVGELGERWPTPEGERITEIRLCLLWLVRCERPSAGLDQLFEPVDVQLAGSDLQDVTVRSCTHLHRRRLVTRARLRFECLAQARHVNPDVLDGVRRRLLPPQRVDQAVDRHDLVSMDEQHRQDEALLAPADLDCAARVVVHLERPEDPKVHAPPWPTPGREPGSQQSRASAGNATWCSRFAGLVQPASPTSEPSTVESGHQRGGRT